MFDPTKFHSFKLNGGLNAVRLKPFHLTINEGNRGIGFLWTVGTVGTQAIIVSYPPLIDVAVSRTKYDGLCFYGKRDWGTK